MSSIVFNSLYLLFTGNYMYAEASNQRQGDLARLITSPFVPDQSTQTSCWRFHYHMYGDQMGTLRVKVRHLLDL